MHTHSNNYREQDTLVNEIIQGMEIAKQLEFHLSSSTSSPESQEMLLKRILSSYDNALWILNWGGSPLGQATTTQAERKATAMPESPISAPLIGECNKRFKDQQDHINETKKR